MNCAAGPVKSTYMERCELALLLRQVAKASRVAKYDGLDLERLKVGKQLERAADVILEKRR